ncbi:MAG: hypothetical protein JNM81_02445 [Rhodospirillaceae bacterium]|nr:hypothetical protein [Rhodospirillaceae bacterium]
MSGSASLSKATPEPSDAELIARAQSLVPVLRERGPQTDRARRVPDETMHALLDAQLCQILAPRRFGGFEKNLTTLLDIGLELARGCGSTAWQYCLLTGHHWILAHYPLEAQKELYGVRNYAFFPQTVSGKGGLAKVVEGGYRVTGQWSFATGIDFSDWVSCTAPIDKENPHPLQDRINFLMPKADVEVLDTWHTVGMRGTGSRDFVLKDVFIPNHRTLSQADLQSGRSPGRQALPEYVGLGAPYFSVLLTGVLPPLLGLTARTIEEFTNYTKGRSGIAGINHQTRPATQIKLGYAQARYDAMHRTARGIFEDIARCLVSGEKITGEQRIRHRRDAAYVGDECAKIVDSLIASAGARSQFQDSVFQQLQRDIHTVRTHVVFDLDDATEAYGRHMLGIPIQPLRF